MNADSKQTLVIGGLYRHFKNHRLYRVIGVGKHTETGEEFVVYEAMYDDHQIWVRPKDMFLEAAPDVECSDRFVFRFEFAETPAFVKTPVVFVKDGRV